MALYGLKEYILELAQIKNYFTNVPQNALNQNCINGSGPLNKTTTRLNIAGGILHAVFMYSVVFSSSKLRFSKDSFRNTIKV